MFCRVALVLELLVDLVFVEYEPPEGLYRGVEVKLVVLVFESWGGSLPASLT